MRKERLLLLLIILSCIIPYVEILFFHRTANLLILLFLYLISFLALIICIAFYLFHSKKLLPKLLATIIPIIAVSSFVLFYGWLIEISDFLFYKLRETRLNEFVIEIKKYGKIKEMSDGRRYWKTLNNIAVEPSISDVDTTNPHIRKKYFLDDILTREQIAAYKYQDFRKRLMDADLLSFSVSRTGEIYFTIAGLLDSRVGLAYNETQHRPKYNDFGAITHWVRVGKNWYVYYN